MIISSDLIGRTAGARKLIAVVHADMVGYSRLIGLDDAGTAERLRKLRSALIDPAIDAHGGKIVNTAGDSLLIVFDSIEGAVRCAVDVQRQIPDYDRDEGHDRAIRFRVGINIGDVIANGDDLYGDGINVAARLQTACPPGGICVSRAVRDHVHDRLKLVFEELGALDLKNIARPVEAFVLRLEAAKAASDAAPSQLQIMESDRPSIAVLAFANMSSDPDQEYFADGVADDIITELSCSRSLFVIARNSSFTYKGRAVGVTKIARELGVRYLLEGSVRRDAAKVRVNTQLIDAENGKHIWAERYDRSTVDLFAVQDEIAAAVTRAIHPAVAEAEQRRALRKHPENLGAWEAYQRALWHLSQQNVEDNAKAKTFLLRAISLDPMLCPAYVSLTIVRIYEAVVYGTSPLDRAYFESVAVDARRAVDIDPGDANAQAALAWITAGIGAGDEAWERISNALDTHPNSAFVKNIAGMVLAFNGQPDRAPAYFAAGLRLNPRDPINPMFTTQMGVACYFAQNYAGAVEASRKAIAAWPTYPQPHRFLAAALGQLGQTQEAGEVLQRAYETAPGLLQSYTRSRPPYIKPNDYAHVLDGLRKAGWHD